MLILCPEEPTWIFQGPPNHPGDKMRGFIQVVLTRCVHLLLPALALLLWVLAAVPATASGQEVQTETATGTIAGVVRDSASLMPMAGVSVAILGGPNPRQATTDAKGAYKLVGLSPGTYRVIAFAAAASGSFGWGPSTAKQVTVGVGNETGVDFVLQAIGEIFGTVTDADKLPVPGLSVCLVGQRYYRGSLLHTYDMLVGTNDRGQFRFQNVRPDMSYHVLVHTFRRSLSAASAVPVDPKLRKSVIVPTYYTGSPNIEEAQSIVLRPGERREVHLTVNRGPSYCMEGVALSAGAVGRLKIRVDPADLTMGAPWGVFFAPPSGTTGADGRFRVCELSPGTHKVTVYDDKLGTFGGTLVSIVDRDVSKVIVDTSPGIAVPGEVVWAGEAPSATEAGKLWIQLSPIDGVPLEDGKGFARSQVPGKFRYDALLVGDYWLQMGRPPKGSYIKDVTYGGHSVLGQRLRVGSEIGDATLRVALGTDGSTATVKVVDDKGNPVPDASICILPTSYVSDAQLVAAAITGNADQNGVWKSEMLSPGEYYVLATDQSLMEPSRERMAALRHALTRATKLELSAGSSRTITVSPVALQ
jgi:hypothetical protein